MDASTITRLGVVGALLLIVVYIIPRILGEQKYPLPPGPPGEFLLGHYRKIPVDAVFKQYAKWGKEYGMCLFSPVDPGSKARAVENRLLNKFQTLIFSTLKPLVPNGLS